MAEETYKCVEPHLEEGSRLSFDGALCTVRYIGEVQGTKGRWLGVEWDDPTRGKHSGEHQGVKYFKCKSKLPTAGSFVRPSRPADKALGFLEAVHEKYVSELHSRAQDGEQPAAEGKPIQISGKIVEEVGFDKIRKQLAELEDLRIVLLDGTRLQGVLSTDEAQTEDYCNELKKIRETCPKIVELDLSRNLLRSWKQVADICGQFPNLRILKLNGNRFGRLDDGVKFDHVSQLSLDETFADFDEISTVTYRFPSLTSLSLSSNGLASISRPISETIKELVLNYNELNSILSMALLTKLPQLTRLSLRGNNISQISNPGTSMGPDCAFSPTLTALDISVNKIDSWSSVNSLPNVFPGLISLRISNNPLYDQPPTPSWITGLPEQRMTIEEAYMLTLARLANLKVLNYSSISEQDRTNGELYYLSLIRKEISASSRSEEQRIIESHPRYKELCDIYQPQEIKRMEESSDAKVDEHSLAARLIEFTFYMPSSQGLPRMGEQPNQPVGDSIHTEHRKEIPRSFDVYRVKAIVSRLFSLTPLRFKLIWETEEWDPVTETKPEDDEWDSSEEDEEQQMSPDGQKLRDVDGKKFVRREEELVDSTREICFWFRNDIREARVRIEPF